MNTYEKGKAIFKVAKYESVSFEWNYTGQRKPKNWDGVNVDSFLITVTHKNKTQGFEFFNSVMETEITNKLNKTSVYGRNWKNEVLPTLKPKMWVGYDKTQNLNDFKAKRLKFLVCGFVNCYFSDITTELNGFSDFCDNFGYDKDSRKAEAIYRQIEEQINEAQSIGMFENYALIKVMGQELDANDEENDLQISATDLVIKALNEGQ